MLKKTITLLLCISMLALTLSSCSVNDLFRIFKKQKNAINIFDTSVCIESVDKYKVADSFAADDGRYYYFFHLGTIDAVPLDAGDGAGLYFDGNNVDLTFRFMATDVERSEQTLNEFVNNNVKLSSSTYTEDALSADTRSMLETRVEAGISQGATTSVLKTFTDTLNDACISEARFKKTENYRMDKGAALGYYFYTSLASMKMYEVVIYNPEIEAVEYMYTYNQIERVIPGLCYSQYGTLDRNDFSIEFDESKMPPLEAPSRNVVSDIEVEVDYAGASGSVKTHPLVIGQPYGALPEEPTRKGYTFGGWTVEGKVVDAETTVISKKPLVAVWDLILSATIQISEGVTASAGNAFNPVVLTVGNSDPSANEEVNVLDYFNLSDLKAEGYEMQIEMRYCAERNILAIFGSEYEISFHSEAGQMCSFADDVGRQEKAQKTNISDPISINVISGKMYFSVATENVFDIDIYDIEIKITFVKS